MKITKIAIKNIHSLKGFHIVNFEEEPLLSAGLFAIIGPTGAGKSTLLDVITLALFNKIPRIGSFSTPEMEKIGSVVTHNTDDALAEIEYVIFKKKYRSTWKIQKNSKGNWKDYEMEVASLPDNVLIETKKSEVPKVNEQMIGLNYEQFRKSILLAQGEFAQFLKSDQNERAKLLMEITGSQIYQEIGKAAFEKYKEKQIESEKLENTLLSIPKLTPDEVTELKNFQLKTEEKIKVLNDNIADKSNKAEYIQKMVSLTNQKTVLEGKWKILIAQKDSLQPEYIKLQKHTSLIPFQNEIISFNEISNLNRIWKEKKETQEQNKINTNKQFDNIANILKKISGKEVTVENAHIILQNIEREYNETLQILEKTQKEGTETKETLQKNLNCIIQNKKTEIEELILESGQNPAILSKELFKFEATDSFDLDKLKSAFEEDKSLLSGLTLKREKIISLLKIEKNLNEIEIGIHQQKAVLESGIEKNISLPIVIQNLSEKIQVLEQDKEKKWKITELKTLREQLQPEEECPLCGSTSHPFCDNIRILDYTKDNLELDELKMELQLKLQLQRQWKEEEQRWLGMIHSNEQQVQKISQELNNGMQDLAIPILQDGFEDVQLKISSTQTHMEDVEKTIQKIYIKNSLLLQLQILQLREQYIELKNKLEKTVKETDAPSFFSGLRETLEIVKSEMIKCVSLLDEILRNVNETDTKVLIKEKELLFKVQKLGYESIENALINILDTEAFNKINEKVQKVEKQEIELNSLLKEIDNQLSAMKNSELIFDPLKYDFILDELNQFKTERDLLLTQKGQYQHRMEVNDHNIKLWSQTNKELTALKSQHEVWELLNDLIGDREGKKYSKFAQNLTLQHVIKYANQRLEKLTDRYRLDYTEIKEDLFIIDLYQANVKRSVKTLSGGESFLVSLSMALALSDMASNKVRIESLFIDEGFGTLDQETLDIAMETMEKLQSESNRTIGIISHVESLKERIITQIRLHKSASGYSTFKVVTL
ncbi:MAG: AAA family ATPase [Saprospiraceae bacterium]|nr:AAA family ATPase [Saprospiraceae bacterium]